MGRTKGGNRGKGKKKSTKNLEDPAATPLVEEREVQPNEEDGERASVPVGTIGEEVRTYVEDGEMERSPDRNGAEEDEEEEDNENNEEGSSSRTVSDPIDSSDSEEETTPMQPMRMYFPATEYKKKIKLSTRCYIHDTLTTLETLENPLTEVERKWFEEHPQFQHIFHMPRDKNHKVMGMWMLLLRTACIEKEKEAWFIVNGVPIRYGIKEHALISGLNCLNYPVDYKEAGSEKFVKKHFKKKKTIRLQDVKEKLEKMVPSQRSEERLKMAVLYFLSSIVIAQTKTGVDATPVEPLFLRAVDDLDFCKTFPWGRMSFDHMLGSMAHTMNHFKGAVKDNVLWPIPGFCIPMELLAFEAIPELGNKFREDNPGADEDCPRMCKQRFKKSEMKGFPLSKINEELGTTKDIDSIMMVRDEEKYLLAEMTEADDDDDKHDVVVASWMRNLRKGYTVFFEEMYNEDVASRLAEEPKGAVNNEIAANESPGNPTFAELVNVVNTMRKEMGEKMTVIVDKVDGLDKRVAVLEDLVKAEQLREKSKEPADMSDEDAASSRGDVGTSADPPNEHVGTSADPPKEHGVPSHEEDKDDPNPKKKGVKRTRNNDPNPSSRVTRSKKIVG